MHIVLFNGLKITPTEMGPFWLLVSKFFWIIITPAIDNKVSVLLHLI